MKTMFILPLMVGVVLFVGIGSVQVCISVSQFIFSSILSGDTCNMVGVILWMLLLTGVAGYLIDKRKKA
jgi:hypothetical protein